MTTTNQISVGEKAHPLIAGWLSHRGSEATDVDVSEARFFLFAVGRLMEVATVDAAAESAAFMRVCRAPGREVPCRADKTTWTVVELVCYDSEECVRRLCEHMQGKSGFTSGRIRSLLGVIKLIYAWLGELGFPVVDPESIKTPPVEVSEFKPLRRKLSSVAVEPQKSLLVKRPARPGSRRKLAAETRKPNVTAGRSPPLMPQAVSLPVTTTVDWFREMIKRRNFYLAEPKDFIEARNRLIDLLMKEHGMTFTQVYLVKCADLDLAEGKLNVRLATESGTAEEVKLAKMAGSAATRYISVLETVQGSLKHPSDALFRSADGGVLVGDDAYAKEADRLSLEVLRLRDKAITLLLRYTLYTFRDLACLRCKDAKDWEAFFARDRVMDLSQSDELAHAVSRYRLAVNKPMVRQRTLWGLEGEYAPFFLARDGDVLTGDEIGYGTKKLGRTLMFSHEVKE